MRLCEELGVGKNTCSAEGVKVSYVRTEEDADMLILINSEGRKTIGTVATGRAYSSARTVYGNAAVTPGESEIRFTLEADESAIVRLEK